MCRRHRSLGNPHQNRIQIVHDLGIREANGRETVPFEFLRSPSIILCIPIMLLSIDLDDQLPLRTEEIDGVVQKRHLPPELEILEAPSTESLP